MLFVKRLTALDTAERDALQNQLDRERRERQQLLDAKAKLALAYNLAVAELNLVKDELSRLRSSGAQRLTRSGANEPADGGAGGIVGGFEFHRTVNFEGSHRCRCIDFDSHLQMYIIGVAKSRGGTGLRSHGLAKVSLLDAASRVDYIDGIHGDIIKSISCSAPGDELVLSTAFDRTLKLSSLASNSVLLSYPLGVPGWSCGFDPVDRSKVYVGLANGDVGVFDIRNTTRELHTLGLSRDFGCLPIHSLQVQMPSGEEGAASPDAATGLGAETAAASPARRIVFGNAATIGTVALYPDGRSQAISKKSLAAYGQCASVVFEGSRASHWLAYCRSSNTPQFLYGAWPSGDVARAFDCRARQTSTVRPSMLALTDRDTRYLIYPDGPSATITQIVRDAQSAVQTVLSTNDALPVLDTILSPIASSPAGADGDNKIMAGLLSERQLNLFLSSS